MALGWPNIEAAAELTFTCCEQMVAAKVASYSEEQCVLHGTDHDCAERDGTETHVLAWLTPDGYWTRSVEVTKLEPAAASAEISDNTDIAPTFWTLKPHADGERFERRAFVRLEAEFPVTAYEGTSALYTLRALDISEQGLRCEIASDQNCVFPDTVALHLQLDTTTIVVDATVAWLASETSEEGERTLVGFSFSEPPEQKTDAIRSYIFRIQMARRREENEKQARL